MNFLFLLFLLVFSFSLNSFEKTLNICAIFKNESRFLKEWIEYHRSVGVEEFWLYNNGSEDDYLAVLQPYIKKRIVRLIDWPSKYLYNDWAHYSFEVQTGAYNHCINESKGRVKWLALIDVDEFIVPVQAETIVEVLEPAFGDVSGICINWVLFGTSFVDVLEENELMIEKLTLRAPLSHSRNLIYKSIVQPLHVDNCPNPHFCIYRNNHWHVNTDRLQVGNGQSNYLCIDKLRINHYWTKDERFFNDAKIPRYKRWGANSDESITALINEKNALSKEEDTLIHRFLDKIKFSY